MAFDAHFKYIRRNGDYRVAGDCHLEGLQQLEELGLAGGVGSTRLQEEGVEAPFGTASAQPLQPQLELDLYARR